MKVWCSTLIPGLESRTLHPNQVQHNQLFSRIQQQASLKNYQKWSTKHYLNFNSRKNLYQDKIRPHRWSFCWRRRRVFHWSNDRQDVSPNQIREAQRNPIRWSGSYQRPVDGKSLHEDKIREADWNTGRCWHLRGSPHRLNIQFINYQVRSIIKDLIPGQTYLMHKGSNVITDPNTGKKMMRTASGRLVEIRGDFEIFVDPDTGKTMLMQTTEDGRTILTDPSSGKIFIRTASGRLQELVDEGGTLYDPATGKTCEKRRNVRFKVCNNTCSR